MNVVGDVLLIINVDKLVTEDRRIARRGDKEQYEAYSVDKFGTREVHG